MYIYIYIESCLTKNNLYDNMKSRKTISNKYSQHALTHKYIMCINLLVFICFHMLLFCIAHTWIHDLILQRFKKSVYHPTTLNRDFISHIFRYTITFYSSIKLYTFVFRLSVLIIRFPRFLLLHPATSR